MSPDEVDRCVANRPDPEDDAGGLRFDISSMDRYHPKSTVERRQMLERMFASRGMIEASRPASDGGVRYGFWGATEITSPSR